MLLLLISCRSTLGIGPVPDTGFFFDTGFQEGDTDVDTDADSDGDADADVDVDVDLDGDGYYEWADCDDTDGRIYNGAPEACDDLDNDCDGITDNPQPGTYTLYLDADDDGFGTTAEAFTDPELCPLQIGYALRGGDCDDSNAALHPDQIDDQCDGVDDNCNSRPDDDHPSAALWFYDLDGDGFAGDGRFGCPGHGATDSNTDCDETRAEVNPRGVEIWFDGIDQDCDGNDTNPPDRDGDGFDASVDCDDLSISISPGVAEACGNGVDDDCNGIADDGCSGPRPADPPAPSKGCATAHAGFGWDLHRR